MNVFNINIEFDPIRFRETIERLIIQKQKGYVCVVDMNVIAMAQENLNYQKIVREATVNTCDGSSLAMLINHIYGTNYKAYNGPDVFEYYIERPYKHLLVGNTREKVEQIKRKVKEKGANIDIIHLDIPFLPVDKFDYEGIANNINNINPDFIWVSLGAPKQEIFIANIINYLNHGVLFGIGAAFNFYIGELHNNKKEIAGLRLIWLERLFLEPQKQMKRIIRFLKVLPKMYIEEKKKSKII